jgi:nickel-dependent lactate racemase
MRYFVRYGKKRLSLDVSDERVVGILSPKAGKAVKDVQSTVRAALQRPIASASLADLLKGKRTALIVTVNHTRPSPRRLLLPVLETCRRHGVTASIIIATGRHRQMTRPELAKHLGADILREYAVLQHDPFDDAAILKKGRTSRGTPIWVNKVVVEHDVVIGIGIIEPSYLCGWSGGRKILMPGLAHHTSIDNNHFFLTHPETKIGRLAGNPVSEDAVEFVSKLPLHFIVYAVVGPDDEVVKVVAGHPAKAHEAGCAWGQRIYRVKKMEADVVISSAGGAPYDCDLVQGKKAVIPAIEAVRKNGVIVLCAECPGGLGAEETFLAWLKNKTPVEVTRDVLDRKQFNLGAHGANILAKPIVQKNATVILVTCPAVAAELRGTYIVTMSSLREAWKTANLLVGPSSSVLFIEKGRRLILC